MEVAIAARMMWISHVSQINNLIHHLAGFLDQSGICLLPSFYMPETETLKWSTHNGIRKTLFFSAFRNVKYIEYKRLKNEEEHFELKSIEPWE